MGPMPTNEVHYRPTRRSMSSDGAWSIASQSFGRPASENPLCTRFAEQATGGGGSNTSASLTSGGASQRCGVLYDPSATVGAAHRSPVRRRMYAHTKACHALVHLVCRPDKVIQTGGLLGAAARAWYAGLEGGPRHALDGGVPAPRVLLGTRLLPLVRRAVARDMLHRVRAPRHEPPAGLPAGGALGILAPPLTERARRPRVPQSSNTRGTRGDVRRGHRRDRGGERRDNGLLLAAWRAEGAGLLRQGEPVERAAAPQRVAACRRGPAPGPAGAREVNPAR
jgi:hypothetical protein